MTSLADLYVIQEQLEEAVEVYKKLLDKEGDSPYLRFNLALIYLKLGKNDLAESELKETIRLKDDYNEAYMVLGVLSGLKKDHKEAAKFYKKVIELDPENAYAHFYLGAAYERIGNRKGAITEFRKCIELDAQYAEAHNYLGYMFAEKGENLDESISLIKRALEIDPENGAYVDSLGWAYFKKGLIDKALEEIERAAGLIENDPVIRDHLGDIYYKKGWKDKAEAEWQKSLAIDPAQELIKEKLKSL